MVDGGRVGLSVLPQGTFGLQRFFPQAICLNEYLQLFIKHQQFEIVLCHGSDEVRLRGIARRFGLFEHGLRFAFVNGHRTRDAYVPIQLEGNLIGIAQARTASRSTEHSGGDAGLRGETERRQVRQFGCFLYG